MSEPNGSTDLIVNTRRDINAMVGEFAKALPRQMPSERFVRTVNTAIQLNPDLAAADRRSLMAACMKAAQDGLLPDGREGALVIYNTKLRVKDQSGREVERWVPAVQWMPMVAGLMKKARNSGEIAGISASVVFRHDHFKLVKGDDERFEHEPNLDVDDSELTEANARGAYCIISLKDGTKIRSWRNKAQIQLARSVSKAGNSLMWTKFWEEGWCKVAIRHACKFAPSSADKEGHDAFMTAATRDDETYDFGRSQARDVTPTADKPTGRSALDRLVDVHEVAQAVKGGDRYDTDTGEVEEPAAMAPQKPQDERRQARGAEMPREEPPPADEALTGENGLSEYDQPSLLGDPLPQQQTVSIVAVLTPGVRRPQELPLTEASAYLLNTASERKGRNGAEWIQAAIKANPWTAAHRPTAEGLREHLERCANG